MAETFNYDVFNQPQRQRQTRRARIGRAVTQRRQRNFQDQERHAEYWQSHEYPAIAVVRTSDGQIRWMNVTEHLKKQGKALKQIVFDGEPFTAASLWRVRDKVLS